MILKSILITALLASVAVYMEETNDRHYLNKVFHNRPAAKILTEEETMCLTDNVYHEARGEGVRGWLAVIHVTLNRTHDNSFPKNVCDVVYQKTNRVCQFSWTCHKRPPISDENLYSTIGSVVSQVASSNNREINDITKGSVYYKRVGVKSSFFKNKLQHITVVGRHEFFGEKVKKT